MDLGGLRPGRHVGGQDVVRVAVQVVAGPVIPHRGARVGVTGSDLHVAQVSARVGALFTCSLTTRPWPAPGGARACRDGDRRPARGARGGYRDRPGALGELTRQLAEASVNIELAYTTFGGVKVVIATDDLTSARAALP